MRTPCWACRIADAGNSFGRPSTVMAADRDGRGKLQLHGVVPCNFGGEPSRMPCEGNRMISIE